MSTLVESIPPHRAADTASITLNMPAMTGATPDQDPLSLIRKVCLRFHSVVRQLRLRKDYRPTIEVDDEYDLQDLLCALLKVEFDEVATDEWTPPYTDGASRTTLLVNRDQIAIVAKKTGPGLTTKELTDQVWRMPRTIELKVAARPYFVLSTIRKAASAARNGSKPP